MKEDISLKIKADTSQAKKDIEKLGKTDVEIKAKLKKPEKNFFKELEQEANELGKKVSDIKLKKESFSKDEVTELKKEIENTALKAKTIYFSEGNKSAEELIKRLKEMHKALGQTKTELKQTQDTFTKMDFVIGNMASMLASTALSAMKELVDQGAELNKQLEYANKKIQTISSQNSLTIDSKTWRMALETGTNPLELKEGLYEIISSVGDVDQAYNLLETANKLAVTGFTDVGNAVDGLTTVMNAYKLSLDEADKVANIFVRTQKYGKTTVGQFQNELSKIVPVAKSLNIQLDEVGTTIALMTSKGVKTPEAATQIASFLNNLSNPTTELAKKFAEITNMSVETFMSRGGTLYDALKMFEDWEKQGNKFSALAIDQEAKNFFKQMSGDLEKYREFLKSINSETDDLNINMNNLMNTQLKASERATVYWQKFATTVGEVKSRVIAFIGDISTGYDKQISATISLNSQLEENLKTLETLGDKNNKTTEEQKKLNEALDNLKILSPDIVKVYEEFTKTGGEYAGVLSVIADKLRDVNELSGKITLKGFDENIKNLEKELKKVQGEINKMAIVDQKTGRMISTEQQIKQGTISITSNPEKFAKYKELVLEKERLENEISNLKNQKNDYVNIITGNKENNKVEVIENNNIKPKFNENKITNSNLLSENGITLLEPAENRDTKDKIESYYKNLANSATDIYNTEMSKLISDGKIDSKTKEKLDSNLQYEKKKAELQSKIEKINLEINSKWNSVSKDTPENQKAIIPELLNLQEQRGELSRELTDLLNQYDYSRLLEENTKNKEKNQLDIQNKFNSLTISEKQAFNEKMSKLIEEGNLKEIEEAQKKHEANLQMIEKERQLTELRLKLNDSSLTSEEKTQVQLQMDKIQTDFEANKIQNELKDSQDNLKKSLDNVSSNLRNLSSLFQTVGDNTGSTTIKNLANIGSLGSTIFDTIKNSSQGEALLESVFGKGAEKMLGLENFTMGAGIGGALSGILGGGAEGNIGSTLGSAVGTIVGGPVGSVVGGALGSAVGSVFGRSSKKKKKREERKRRAAQERLKQGMISGQFKWADVLEEYNEDLQRAGAGEYINLLDKVSTNTNYDNVLSVLNGAKRGADGVSMSALKQLMPQYTESQIMDWFKSITGGAVLNGDTLSTGEGKYGAIDISALAQQVTNANREMEQSLKETIKNIIDFSADSLASVVKEGFFDGLDNLGDNIEKMIANSLKNAFINTELSKNLFNGLSDKVSDYVKDLFKNDKNLGIDLETGSLEKLTFTQYIELIKKYMEMSNDKLEELFKELGLNMDNLTESMDSLNKNMSKNVVSGIATNLWKQNLGIKEPYKINQNIHLEIPVTLNGKEMDRYIIKTVNGSLQRSRRSGNGIGRG